MGIFSLGSPINQGQGGKDEGIYREIKMDSENVLAYSICVYFNNNAGILGRDIFSAIRWFIYCPGREKQWIE